MWPYYPDLLSRAVPRYTSYPTAAEFVDDVGPEDYGRALGAIEPGDELSLYVHIPYCHEICSYCGCNTGRANRSHRLSAYIEALEGEIDLVSRTLAGRGNVKRIAFGGGSPNAIEPLAFVRLIDRLTTAFKTTAPTISIEIDPRHLDPAWLPVFKTIGVQRASLGVQTFTPAIQATIGRLQPPDLIASTVDGLRQAGVSSINFDLMYGLPGQSIADIIDATSRAARLGADRIALFGYAHLPSMFPRQRQIDSGSLPGPDARFAQAAAGHDALIAEGYVAVGFDHFARPYDSLAQAVASGSLRRNFQGFTEDSSRFLIGLGASAISDLPQLLVQNEKSPGLYRSLIREGRLATRRGVARCSEAKRRASVIEQLLCHGRASPEPSLLRSAQPGLEPFVDHDLIRIENGTVSIAPEGRPYGRAIAARFDGYREQSHGHFSHAV